MTTILVRTVIFYVLIVFALRLSGKRQIGQLELSELVTSLLLSELAAIPITNNNIPLLHGLIPILLLVIFEVIISFLTVKNDCMRKTFDGSPSTLIYRGRINQEAMQQARVTMNELLAAIRTSGFPSIEQADYVFLESSGKISVIPKRGNQPVTPQDLNLALPDNGVDHALIIDGAISNNTLKHLFKTKQWLYEELRKRSLKLKDVFYFGIDDSGKIYIIEKEPKK